MTPNVGCLPFRVSQDEDRTMTRTILSAVTILSLTLPGTASANDIVDFLRAIQGPAPHRGEVHHDDHQGHGHRQATIPTRHAPSHNSHRHSNRVPVQQFRTRRPVVSQRPGVSFQISFGNNTIPTPRTVLLPPPVLEVPPVPGSFGHLPHQIGEIVTCNVPLEPHMIIKDACEVAPNAVPVIVAVRNPHLGRCGSRGCIESLVYVEVLVPACPLQRVRVSPCSTKVRLDFGQYEVDITSRNGFVEIDYDN